MNTPNANPLLPWDVVLDGTIVDRVWFLRECDAQHVRRALIEHDGFDARIDVQRTKEVSDE